LSPDAALWLVPWGALPVGDDKLLIERFVLEHVVSGRDIVSAARPHTSSRLNPRVIFANPQFDMTSDLLQRARQAIFGKLFDPEEESRQRSLSQLSQSGKNALPKAAPLPATQVEAQSITPQLKRLAGENPLVYSGPYALESVVKVVHRPKVVT